jgi:cytochrome c
MKRIFITLLVSVFLSALVAVAFAGDHGTAAEAEALMKKAVTYVKANGKEKAFAEINNPQGQFVDRDLYISVYDFTGKCLAQGANAKMIGKDLMDLKDPDGYEIVKERLKMAKVKDKFWQDYKFTNPLNKKIEPKSTYCERVGDIVLACGIYKK